MKMSLLKIILTLIVPALANANWETTWTEQEFFVLDETQANPACPFSLILVPKIEGDYLSSIDVIEYSLGEEGEIEAKTRSFEKINIEPKKERCRGYEEATVKANKLEFEEVWRQGTIFCSTHYHHRRTFTRHEVQNRRQVEFSLYKKSDDRVTDVRGCRYNLVVNPAKM